MSLSILGRAERLRHLLPEIADLRITGFQSPAEDEKEERLSLDKLTGLGAPQIWVLIVEDASLLGFGLFPGDRLVVDRSTSPASGSLVVVDTEGDHMRVRLMARDALGRPALKTATPDADPIHTEGDVTVWGVVRWVVSFVGVP